MLLAVVLLLVGVVAGLVRGGKLANISGVRFRHPWLVFVGLALQVGAQALSKPIPAIQRGGAGPVIVAVSYAFIVAFVAFNRRLPGTVFIGAGLLANVVVILANGAMPVSLSALHHAGVTSLSGLQSGVKHHPMGPGTRLGFLGDVIPVPPLGVVSVGDCVLGVGVMLLVYRLVSYAPKRSIEHTDCPDPRSPGGGADASPAGTPRSPEPPAETAHRA